MRSRFADRGSCFAPHLVSGIGKLVERVIDSLRKNTVLHRDRALDENVVPRLRFADNVHLLNAEGHGSGDFLEGAEDEVGAGLEEGGVVAALLDDCDVLGAHAGEAEAGGCGPGGG